MRLEIPPEAAAALKLAQARTEREALLELLQQAETQLALDQFPDLHTEIGLAITSLTSTSRDKDCEERHTWVRTTLVDLTDQESAVQGTFLSPPLSFDIVCIKCGRQLTTNTTNRCPQCFNATTELQITEEEVAEIHKGRPLGPSSYYMKYHCGVCCLSFVEGVRI